MCLMAKWITTLTDENAKLREERDRAANDAVHWAVKYGHLSHTLPTVPRVVMEDCQCAANCANVGLVEVFEGSGSHHETCATCQGEGKTPVRCGHCNDGKVLLSSMDSHMCDCKVCHGHGYAIPG